MAVRTHLAVYAFAVLDGAPDDRHIRAFFRDSGTLRAAAERAAGFIGQASTDGPIVRTPRFFDASRYSVVLQSLSWWTDMASAISFVHHSPHRPAMRRYAVHVVHGGWPRSATWWTAAIPTLDEGIARLEYLHDNGPSPHAAPLPAADPAARLRPRRGS